MTKDEKIEAMLRGHRATGQRGAGLDPRYEGYFACFNAQDYFGAHEILEHLWLRSREPDRAFYKGLIQLAGAFVHLQKQFRRPHHPKDATRVHPAVRLFRVAARNLAPYRPQHLRLDVERVWTLGTTLAEQIVEAGYANPWTPQTAPTISLGPAGANPLDNEVKLPDH